MIVYEINDLKELNIQKSLARLALNNKIITHDEYDLRIKELNLIEESMIRDKKIKDEKFNLAKKKLIDLVLT